MKEIEKLIKQELEEKTPDMKEKILARAKCEEQLSPDAMAPASLAVASPKRRFSITKLASLAAMLFIVFTVGILLGNYVGLPTGDGEYASLYFDVNPSIELTVSEDGTVGELLLLNDDAKAALSELKLSGVELNTAIHAVIGALYMNGYLQDGTDSILVSARTPSERFDGLLNTAVSEVNSIMSRANIVCSLVAQELKGDETTETQADENGVSLGKMSLVNKIVESIEDYTDADASTLAGMSIKELNHLYNSAEKPDKEDEGDRENDFFEIIGSQKPEYIDKSDALELVLDMLGIDEDATENERIYAIHGMTQNGPRLVYKVSFIYGDTRYEYEVDCISAEVTLISGAEGDTPTAGGPPTGQGGDRGDKDQKEDRPDKNDFPSLEDIFPGM
ncbi:MAG: hypothetical protein IJY01_01895 [Clostridia bacterium]|nr:hypothetical protein [Clostridia bacterium]